MDNQEVGLEAAIL